MGHAREEERQHEQVAQADDAGHAEQETPSRTRFTNRGAIPAVENGTAAQGPTASERAFGSLTVTARGLNVRSGPSTNDRILGVLHRGDSVQEIGRSNGWVQISFGGQAAFVHEHYVSRGGGQEARGHAPSPEGQAEAMDMFREVNGEQGRGHAPSKEAQAEAMQIFREANGEQGRGHAPSKEAQAEAMQIFREVNAEPATAEKAAPAQAAPGQGHAPSKEGQAEAMQIFREVNGEQGRGHAPSKEGQAEAMQIFREVNGEPAAGHAPNQEKLDELLRDLE